MGKSIINLVWSPLVITALAVLGLVYGWPIEYVAPPLIVIFAIGLALAIINVKHNAIEAHALRLKQLAEYFNRRFMGNSAMSIFVLIDSLYNVDNPPVWDWARSCGSAQRIFDNWSDSFITRVQGDFRTRKLTFYLHTYLNELWAITNHYQEFIEQFYEVAERFGLPQDITEQYNRFAVEYNAFTQNFREAITELKQAAHTEIEPPSVKNARELSASTPSTPKARRE